MFLHVARVKKDTDMRESHAFRGENRNSWKLENEEANQNLCRCALISKSFAGLIISSSKELHACWILNLEKHLFAKLSNCSILRIFVSYEKMGSARLSASSAVTESI